MRESTGNTLSFSGLGRHLLNIPESYVLAGIVMLALLLRLWGVNFGLPYLYHPDEPVNFRVALDMMRNQDPDPHLYLYPSLLYDVHAAVYTTFFLGGYVTGQFDSPWDIQGPSKIIMGVGTITTPLFLIGRFLSVAYGIAAVIAIYYIGKRLTGSRATGTTAALLLAVSPSAVTHSRLITPDMLLVACMMIAAWGAVQILHEDRTRSYVLTGVAAGLAMSAKQTGIFILAVFFMAHFLREGLQGLKSRRFYLSLGLSLLSFAATTPFAFLNFWEFWHTIVYQANIYSSSYPGMEGSVVDVYVRYLLTYEGMMPVLALIGCVLLLLKRSKTWLMLYVFPLVYLPFISLFSVKNDRTLLPVIPWLILGAAYTLVQGYQRLSSNASNRPRIRKGMAILIGVLGAATVAFPLIMSIKAAVHLTAEDSRETARIWLDESLQEGAHIALEAYGPYIDPQRFDVTGFNSLVLHSADWYRVEGFEYLVFSQGMFQRYYDHPDQYSDVIAQYDDLFLNLAHVRTFTDGGYVIHVYRVPVDQ